MRILGCKVAAAVLLSMPFLGPPTFADSLSFSLSTSQSMILVEGHSFQEVYTVENVSQAPIVIVGPLAPTTKLINDADPSDKDEVSASVVKDKCFTTLKPGKTCTFTVEIAAGPDEGKGDNDFGSNTVDMKLVFFPENGTQTTSDAPTVAVKVIDSFSVITPEPSTFFLLGTGLAGLLGFGRRKFTGLGTKQDLKECDWRIKSAIT